MFAMCSQGVPGWPTNTRDSSIYYSNIEAARHTSSCLSHGYLLKVIYHPLYGMNIYVLIWGDWLSCDPLRGSHDSQSPHMKKHECPILWQL